MSEKQEVQAIENAAAETQVAQADEQAGFDASFTEARADEAPAQVVEQQAEPEPKAPNAEADPAPAEPAIEEKVGLTAEQLTAMLAKMPKIEELETMTTQELRKVHGKFGEINRVLQDLQKNLQERPTAQALNLSAAKFKRLSEEYPELAQLLSEDFKELGVTDGSQAANNPEDLNQTVAAIKDDLSKQMQHNLLLIQHKDYPTVVASDEFKVWAQTLPTEEQEELNSSWDAVYIGEKLTAFKDWLNKKQNGSVERRERLQRATLPQGKQAPPTPTAMTEEDGFAMAFKK